MVVLARQAWVYQNIFKGTKMFDTLNYQPLEDRLTQKRKIYAKMLAGGLTPRSTEMVSGIAIPNSKTQGFADILKVGLGTFLSSDTEKQLSEIKNQKAIQKAKIFGKIMGLPDNDANTISSRDILALEGTDPAITTSLFKNHLKNQELTREQKNANASGYDAQGNPYNPLSFTVDSNNQKHTATQKDAYSSGGLTPLKYNQSFENNKFNNRRVLQEDSQQYGIDRQNRGFDHDVSMAGVNNRYRSERDATNHKNKMDTTVIDADFYDPIAKTTITKKMRLADYLADNTQQNISDAAVDKIVFNDDNSAIGASSKTLEQEEEEYQDKIKKMWAEGNLKKGSAQPPITSPNNRLIQGKVTQSPQTIEKEKLAQKRKAELEKSYPMARLQIEQALETIEKIKTDPDFESHVGSIQGMIPSFRQSAVDFDKNNDSLKSDAFMEAYKTLRGASGITDIEGQKATDSIFNNDARQSEKQYLEQINNFKLFLETQKKAADAEYEKYVGFLPEYGEIEPDPVPAKAVAPAKAKKYQGFSIVRD